MNKVIKGNIFYSFLISFVISLSLIDVYIYDLYWEEKFDRFFGKLDYLKGEGIPIDFSDYSRYGPSLHTIITSFCGSFDSIVLCVFVFAATAMYVIIPLFFIYFDSALKVVCIVLDIIWGILYVYFFVYPVIIEFTLCGFIPMVILAPILFLMLVWFRLRQYKKLGYI